MSFIRWLGDQAYRMDNTGNFAREIISTKDIPKSSDFLEWYRFVNEVNKRFSIDVFTDVWEEYREGYE